MNLLEYPKISVSCNLIHQDMRGKDQAPKTCRSNREFELYPNSHVISILSYRNQTHTKKIKAQNSRLSGWHKW